jgi:cold-inducible RNA-binding protein
VSSSAFSHVAVTSGHTPTEGRFSRFSYIEVSEMAKKLFVGNLSYKTTDDSLRSAFEQAGSVLSASVIMDKMTGKSRGFGFVEMEDADADAAINNLNGKEVDGRPLTVNEARPMAPRTGGFSRENRM